MANGHISDDFADILIEAILTRDLTLIPTSIFIGLTLELPIDNNGTGIEAPDDPDYERFEIVLEAASWVSMGAGSRSMESAIEVVFNEASVEWGNVVGYTLYDSFIDGVYLGYGIIDPYFINAGLTPRLPAGLIIAAMSV